jgi:hypothetical protein
MIGATDFRQHLVKQNAVPYICDNKTSLRIQLYL